MSAFLACLTVALASLNSIETCTVSLIPVELTSTAAEQCQALAQDWHGNRLFVAESPLVSTYRGADNTSPLLLVLTPDLGIYIAHNYFGLEFDLDLPPAGTSGKEIHKLLQSTPSWKMDFRPDKMIPHVAPGVIKGYFGIHRPRVRTDARGQLIFSSRGRTLAVAHDGQLYTSPFEPQYTARGLLRFDDMTAYP